MDPAQMARRCPHSPPARTRWLNGWRLTFGGEDPRWEGPLPPGGAGRGLAGGAGQAGVVGPRSAEAPAPRPSDRPAGPAPLALTPSGVNPLMLASPKPASSPRPARPAALAPRLAFASSDILAISLAMTSAWVILTSSFAGPGSRP